jgi:cytochrome P450
LRLRLASPGSDLISHLATVEADGEKLRDIVLMSFLRQLMNAGGDTTFWGASALQAGLSSNPDQLETVRSDRRLITQTIDAPHASGSFLSSVRTFMQELKSRLLEFASRKERRLI